MDTTLRQARGAQPVAGWNFRRDWSFLVPAGLLTLFMLFAVFNYLAQAAGVEAEIQRLGFPGWLRIVLAVAKLLGVAAIWFAPTPALRHFGYAGLLFNFLMAFMAHVAAADGEFVGALMALTLLGLAMWRDPRP